MATLFYNKKSINDVKAANNNAPMEWGEGNKPGIFAFSCGNCEGLVSQAAVKHLQAGGDPSKLMIADVDYTDSNGEPASCTMMMLASSGIKKVLGTL